MIFLQAISEEFYTIFMKPLKIAHTLWQTHLLGKTSFVVDATCGNGYDSLFLASLPCVTLYCIDIQKEAIDRTKKTLLHHQNCTFYNTSHQDLSFIQEPIDLIVYNLGYLPHSDKSIITTPKTTLLSLKSALSILKPEGMISLMIYTGHQGGNEEKKAIFSFIETLSPRLNISYITHPFKTNCPEIVLIH